MPSHCHLSCLPQLSWSPSSSLASLPSNEWDSSNKEIKSESFSAQTLWWLLYSSSGEPQTPTHAPQDSTCLSLGSTQPHLCPSPHLLCYWLLSSVPSPRGIVFPFTCCLPVLPLPTSFRKLFLMRLRVTTLILYAKAGFQHCASVPCFPNSLQVPEGKGFFYHLLHHWSPSSSHYSTHVSSSKYKLNKDEVKYII